jgi:hypothetical protein
MMGNPGTGKENSRKIPGLYLLAANDLFTMLQRVPFIFGLPDPPFFWSQIG